MGAAILADYMMNSAKAARLSRQGRQHGGLTALHVIARNVRGEGMGIRIAPKNKTGDVLVWCRNCGAYQPVTKVLDVVFQRSSLWCSICEQRLQDWVSKLYKRNSVSER
jgi:hypothetical protein